MTVFTRRLYTTNIYIRNERCINTCSLHCTHAPTSNTWKRVRKMNRRKYRVGAWGRPGTRLITPVWSNSFVIRAISSGYLRATFLHVSQDALFTIRTVTNNDVRRSSTACKNVSNSLAACCCMPDAGVECFGVWLGDYFKYCSDLSFQSNAMIENTWREATSHL